MSAAPSLAPVLEVASRRGFCRYPIDVPLDVITLRSGIPDNSPGRCTDLSEVGVGAVVAGELVPGQQVAVEFRLPNVGVPVRSRAQVRYQDQLHCGLQFVALSAEQREMIRYWARQAAARSAEAKAKKDEAPKADVPVVAAAPDKERRGRRIRVRRRRFYALLAAILALGSFAWWQWQRAWNELEAKTSLATESGVPLRVSPETMERQIAYKVNPVYPEAARVAGTQGLVVLDAVIASDGTVKRLQPVGGPDVLAQSALEAVQSWKFTPYRVNGDAVEVETTIAVEFRLN